jgi:hypothetical protein
MLSSISGAVYAPSLTTKGTKNTKKEIKTDHFVFFVMGTQYFKFNAIISLRKSDGLGHQVRLSQF